MPCRGRYCMDRAMNREQPAAWPRELAWVETPLPVLAGTANDRNRSPGLNTHHERWMRRAPRLAGRAGKKATGQSSSVCHLQELGDGVPVAGCCVNMDVPFHICAQFRDGKSIRCVQIEDLAPESEGFPAGSEPVERGQVRTEWLLGEKEEMQRPGLALGLGKRIIGRCSLQLLDAQYHDLWIQAFCLVHCTADAAGQRIRTTCRAAKYGVTALDVSAHVGEAFTL